METGVEFWQQIKAVLEPFRIVVELLAFMIGAIWGYVKFREYRELKHFIQFDIDANIIRLPQSVMANSVTYERDRSGNKKMEVLPEQELMYAVEVYLKFENKGKTRFRLYNAEVALNTMRDTGTHARSGGAKFDKNTGRTVLKRLRTSGNIVPEKTGYYYMEPGVAQTISYLILIPEPKSLLQVIGKFSMEQERIFPYKEKGKLGLLPHTASKTFKVHSTSPEQKTATPQ
ncbi:MAG: hypothetical protein KQH63_20585 [Desulfobulbaceae bacterium]|nr:hypothetical protein [Desulfobulbaceae bacterium]